MSPTDASHGTSTGAGSLGASEMHLEVLVIPVSDVDRAKQFYGKLGWRLDADVSAGDEVRLVQFTPPGSGCSVQFGTNLTTAAPGSGQGVYLTVSDLDATRHELEARGVEVSEVFHEGTLGDRFHGVRPCARTGGRSQQLRLIRHLQRPGRQRLAVPGGHDEAAGASRPGHDSLRVDERSGCRAASGRGGPRRAREADGSGRPELARLVRGLHDAGAGRRRAAVVRDDETTPKPARTRALRRASS